MVAQWKKGIYTTKSNNLFEVTFFSFLTKKLLWKNYINYKTHELIFLVLKNVGLLSKIMGELSPPLFPNFFWPLPSLSREGQKLSLFRKGVGDTLLTLAIFLWGFVNGSIRNTWESIKKFKRTLELVNYRWCVFFVIKVVHIISFHFF